MMRTLVFFAALAVAALTKTATAQPSVSYATPAAVRPGQTVKLTLHGDKLGGSLAAWSSFPAKVEFVPPGEDKKDGKSVLCKVTLEQHVAAGIGGLILGSAGGASDPLLVMIDDLPSASDNGNNHSPAEAQAIELPTAVDGASDGAQFDYYKFAAKAGQRVSVEVVAARLATNFDAVVRLLDAGGKELLLADDDASLGADCRFAHTFEADGEYLLEVRDNRYQAGQRYRLRVGDFPLVTTPYPLGGRRGSTPQIGFAGPAADGAAPLLVSIPDVVAGGRLPIGARFPGGQSSGLAVLATSTLPEEMEREPNDEAKAATSITLPCAVSGQFTAEGDRDYFEFPATKGQQFHFAATSRSLGSPSFVYMQLFDAAGGKVAETAVGDSDELAMSFRAAADGVYRLMAEDLNRAGGPGYGYRIEITRGGDFSLSLKNDKETTTKFAPAHDDGAFSLDLVCARSGYDGPITLEIEDPQSPLRLLNPVIPEKAKAHKLIVALPRDAQPGQLYVARIVGRGRQEGREITSLVSTVDYVRTKTPQAPYPPAWRDGLVSVAAGGAAGDFYDVSLERPEVFLPQQIGQAELKLTLARGDKEFKDAITVAAEDPPAGLSAAVKQEGDAYTITLAGAKGLPAGRHTLHLISYGEFKGVGQLVERRVPLEIGSPLAVNVSPAGPLAAGKTQKVKVTVARKGADQQPVTLRWAKLPGGVTGGEATLAADATEIELELSAAAEAEAQSFSDLTVLAVTQYTGQEIAVSSPPAVLEVKKPE